MHRPGKQNQVADALSKQEIIAYVAALSNVESKFLERIKEEFLKELVYAKLLNDIKAGLVRRHWIEDNLIFSRGIRLYVPAGGGLCWELL